MPRTPSAFPFSGRLRRRAINPTPPKRVKAWGDGPLRPEVMYPVVEHTQPNRAARNHSRSRAPHHRTQKNALTTVIATLKVQFVVQIKRLEITFKIILNNSNTLLALMDWLVVLFYRVTTVFESLNAELSHFHKSFRQFSSV